MEAVEVESSGQPSRREGEPLSCGAGGSSILVIGNGMAGARLAEEILKRPGGKRTSLTVIGDEPRGNYNRILLSSVLGQFKDVSDIVLNPIAWYEQNGIELHTGVRATSIHRVTKRMVDANT